MEHVIEFSILPGGFIEICLGVWLCVSQKADIECKHSPKLYSISLYKQLLSKGGRSNRWNVMSYLGLALQFHLLRNSQRTISPVLSRLTTSFPRDLMIS